MIAPMRWAQLVAVVVAMVGCDSHPLAPDGARAATNPRSEQVMSTAPTIGAARWLTLRSDGLYDELGHRRMSREKANALHMDKVFELHRQAKLDWLHQSDRGFAGGQSKAKNLNEPRYTARTQILGARSRLSIPAPVGPRLAVAADDPCFFDARVWCNNELGGELPMPSGGGAGGGTDPSDYSSLDCANIVANMNRAYAAYLSAQFRYMTMAGGGVGDAPFSPGIMEGMLMAQYDTMMSYLADYNLWKGLAAKYKCR